MHGRVLIVAGSDSGGGAGIQADIKATTALGAFAMTAVTAITAQDTTGVHGVHMIPPDMIRAQIACVLADIGADAVKTGMLGDAATVALVAGELAARASAVPVVVDPVMVAKGGHPLLAAEAVAAARGTMVPLAALLTPNIPEAETLTGVAIEGEAGMRAAAAALLAMGARAVLMKGGHLAGDDLVDLLVTPESTHAFRGARVHTRHTHGTGCTLASACAAGLAQGLPPPEAVARARAYVQAALLSAPGYGAGHGPLNHAVTFDPARIAPA